MASAEPVEQGDATGGIIEIGVLRIDCRAQRVTVDGRRACLAPQEFQILGLLAERRGEVVTKRDMLDRLYGGCNEPEPAMIDVFVSHLRKILAAAARDHRVIETLWCWGYRLREPDAQRA